MFRVQADIKNVNYDAMLDTFMNQIKQQQQNGTLGGMKIPPMLNMDILKKMPQETKDAMVASAINAEQQRMKDMIEMYSAKAGQNIKIHRLQVLCVKEANCTIRLNLDVTSMDSITAIEKIATILIEDDLKTVMGEDYQENISVSEAVTYIKEQNEKKQYFFILKSMSNKKKMIIEKLESMAADIGISLELTNIRFMVQS